MMVSTFKRSQSTIARAQLTSDERLEALCRQFDPELFFPEQGAKPDAAKAVCMGCPLRAAHLGGNGRCLDVAMENREGSGVFGGLSETERKTLARQRREAE
jgi:WhiB family redox-sensing transcriptional regulator